MQCSFFPIPDLQSVEHLFKSMHQFFSKYNSSVLPSDICLYTCCNPYKMLCKSFSYLFVFIKGVGGLVPFNISGVGVLARSVCVSFSIHFHHSFFKLVIIP